MNTKIRKFIYLQTVATTDLATGLIKNRTVPLAQTDLVANQVELTWITHYQARHSKVWNHDPHQLRHNFKTSCHRQV